MHEIRETSQVRFMPEISLDKYSKLHGHQTMKLQLNYEIMLGNVQKFQIAYLIPLKTIETVSYNKFSKPGRAGF